METKNNIEKALEIVKNFTGAEWREFIHLTHKYKFICEDYPEYKNPISTPSDANELQNRIVQLCIDFIQERNLTDIDEVCFGVDGLKDSVQYGEWCSGTDSSISLLGLQQDENMKFPTRHLIAEYF